MTALLVALSLVVVFLGLLLVWTTKAFFERDVRHFVTLDEQRRQLQARIDEYHEILRQLIGSQLDVPVQSSPSRQSQPDEQPTPVIPPAVATHIGSIEDVSVRAELKNDALNLLAADPDISEADLLTGLFELDDV